MKTCYKCKEELELVEFAINKSKPDGLNSQCRKCQKILRKIHYEKHKKKTISQVKDYKKSVQEYIIKVKDAPCKDCDKKYPYYVMDFDHLGDKDFSLSMYHTKGLNLVKKEIAKCELVCANCHRQRTYNRLHG